MEKRIVMPKDLQELSIKPQTQIACSGNSPILKVLMLVKYHPGLRETGAPADTFVR
jgi:hypothetical protein